MNILQIQVQNTFKHKNTIVKFKDGVNLLRDKKQAAAKFVYDRILKYCKKDSYLSIKISTAE